MTRVQTNAGRSAGSALLLAILALLAVIANGTIVQTHVHPAHRAGLSHGSGGIDVASPVDEACGLCTALAAFDPLLPTEGVALAPPVVVAILISPAIGTRLRLRSRGHAWRSRAPPTLRSI